MSANPGRLAAARALMEVEQGAHVEDALARFAPHETGQGSAGGQADRGLAWFLALGVLRHRARVDAALRPHLSRPLATLDPPVRAALRLGAYEKLYARTAAHAAVHQAVEVASAAGGGRAKGLVNAVLRRVEPAVGLSRAESLDHPDWLVERWAARYGWEATEAWCLRNEQPPPLTIVARDAPEALAAELREAGLTVEPVALHGAALAGLLRIEGHGGAVTAMPGFAEGRFWVQDPASVAVADLVGAAPGMEVLDACAAPGGKAFRLLSQGARVVAVDRDPDRLRLLRESAARLGYAPPAVDAVVHDWERGDGLVGRTFAAVLVDAPCTALGTVRRHPEIRWRRQPADLPAMAARQRVILDAVAPHVGAGGALVYAVCSPEPEEGPDVVRAFVAANPDFALVREISTAPPEADEDAFYGARLERAR